MIDACSPLAARICCKWLGVRLLCFALLKMIFLLMRKLNELVYLQNNTYLNY